MSIEELFEHFDAYERLPVSVNDIRDQIIDMGCQDDIQFHLVDVDPSKLRGVLERYTVHNAPYAEPTFCSNICIARDLTAPWRRVVAAKELLHILDSEDEAAANEESVVKLINRMSQPFEFQNETRSSFSDKSRLVLAIGILVPKECRKWLKQIYELGQMTEEEIARIADIPDRYVPPLLDEGFEYLFSPETWKENKA